MTDITDPTNERMVYLEEILEILDWSRSKFYAVNPETGMKWYKELQGAGVIVRHKGGKVSHTKLGRWRAFPSKIRNWISLKASRGQSI